MLPSRQFTRYTLKGHCRVCPTHSLRSRLISTPKHLQRTPLIILRSYNVTRLRLSLVAAPGPVQYIWREGGRQAIWRQATFNFE